MIPDQTAHDLGPKCLQYRLPKKNKQAMEQTTKIVTVMLPTRRKDIKSYFVKTLSSF